MIVHDRETRGHPTTVYEVEGEKLGSCILANDGRLFGPFKTREDALYWAESQEIPCYSTYTLLSPRVDPGKGRAMIPTRR